MAYADTSKTNVLVEELENKLGNHRRSKVATFSIAAEMTLHLQ